MYMKGSAVGNAIEVLEKRVSLFICAILILAGSSILSFFKTPRIT